MKTTDKKQNSLSLQSKTMLKPGRGKNTVQKVLDGKIKPSQVSQNIMEEARMLLHEKGFNVDSILNKYIDIMNTEKVTYRGSDIVSVLDRLSTILGMEVKPQEQANDNVVRRLQNAPIQDIKVFIVKMTEDANRYIEGLNKIESIEEADTIS